MKIHEYQARELFKQYNIPTNEGILAHTLEEAVAAAKKLGYPVVVKAQVHVGGRGKAGGVKFVTNEKDLIEKTKAILGMNLKGSIVRKVLVVRAAEIKKEYYLGMILDRSTKSIMLMLSSAGGVEIEEVAAKTPELIHKLPLPLTDELNLDEIRNVLGRVFEPAHFKEAVDMLTKLYKLFVEKDCSIAEINPLIIDENNKLLAIDGKINFDDNAIYRHADVAAMLDPEEEDKDELIAKDKNLSFVKLDGNIGCMVNGAGLAMATLDIIKLYGGDPANFLDVGGSSNPQKVIDALSIITSNKKVNGILINIFGGITRCDDIANGLMTALSQMKITHPIVVRLTGTNEELAVEILKKSPVDLHPQTSMSAAVKKIIELTK